MALPLNYVCPIHRSPLRPNQIGNFECDNGHGFETLKGITRFVSSHYGNAFGFQWLKFQKTQLDSYTMTTITKDRLDEVLGESLVTDLKDKLVLEVGCGAGRFTERLLQYGTELVSMDLSTAVDANIQNFPITNSHSVIQADLTQIPFEENNFDLVVCLGVIQHTPNPEFTIECLAKQLKPGGYLVLDHYANSFAWKIRSARAFRVILKRLPPRIAFYICQRIYYSSKPFFQLSKNRIYRKFLNMLFPIVYFDMEIPSLPEYLKDEWSILDTFDSLTDWYKHRRSREEILKDLQTCGLEVEMCEYGGNGVIARARAMSRLIS
jgi:2-polyprenyl-3-methyl-5-hydroxy-6-metoxy-1,4-benzoquinol methylase